MYGKIANIFVIYVCAVWCAQAQIPEGFKIGTPIPLGHSHNDYEQKRPLWEALENGFTSIEIDVFGVGENELRVSHIPFALKLKPHLEDLYMKPLSAWIDMNAGHVFPSDTAVTLTLMIDMKGDGNKSYPHLRNLLERYKKYLTVYEEGKLIKKGALRIMLSGNRPMELLNAEKEQLVCIDGALGPTYYHGPSKVFVARESAPFSAYFKKRTNGKLSVKEIEILSRLAWEARQKNREIRFWAAGNNPKRWEILKESGVTVINADKLKRFNTWIKTM